MFDEYLVDTREVLDGVQKIYKFGNGYGASVIRSIFSKGHEEGLWELAVIDIYEDGYFELCYDTPITDDVIGNLTGEEVNEYLKKIKDLQGIIRLGHFTGKLYIGNIDPKTIGECCRLIRNVNDAEKLRAELRKKCENCFGCPEAKKAIGV